MPASSTAVVGRRWGVDQGPLIVGCFADLIAIDYTGDLALLDLNFWWGKPIRGEDAASEEAAVEQSIVRKGHLVGSNSLMPRIQVRKSQSLDILTGSGRGESPRPW